MKERPILMTPENAQKCHEGVKTQTRRTNGLDEVNSSKLWDYPQMQKSGIAVFLDSTQANPYNNALDVKCPYGQVGDRLWVREAHQFDPPDDGTWCYTAFMGCKGAPLEDIPERFRKPQHCLYRGKWEGMSLVWRPSLNMPRWACRTVVEITALRVERVQEISEEDALAEGVRRIDHGREYYFSAMRDESDHRNWVDPTDAYKELWESIHGKGSWELNPWVWVIEFRRVAECQPQGADSRVEQAD